MLNILYFFKNFKKLLNKLLNIDFSIFRYFVDRLTAQRHFENRKRWFGLWDRSGVLPLPESALKVRHACQRASKLQKTRLLTRCILGPQTQAPPWPHRGPTVAPSWPDAPPK